MKKNILIISYTFPPSSGIGGRRWAKFSKYLTRLGYCVHIIYAPGNTSDKSLWFDDVVDNENIKLYPVKSYYPASLLIKPKTIWQKLQYRFSLFIVKLTSKGTPYDRAWLWNRSMLRKAEQIIEINKIKNVIVSCAPFSNSYSVLKLKIKFSDLNLCVDFRDPWTWGSGYGFVTLEQKKIDFEKIKEKEVIENFDHILIPSIEMKNYLDSTYSEISYKTHILSHGFDKDEITQKPKIHSNVTKLMLYGTLYSNLEEVFEKISLFISGSNKKASLDIYSSETTYKEIFQSRKLIDISVNYYDQMLPKDLFDKMNFYDYVLIIQPFYAKDFITTKIYEIIYSHTPIILISNKGKLFDFILDNNLGICFSPEDLKEENLKNIFLINPKKFAMNQFPIENYSFEFITSKLISYFK